MTQAVLKENPGPTLAMGQVRDPDGTIRSILFTSVQEKGKGFIVEVLMPSGKTATQFVDNDPRIPLKAGKKIQTYKGTLDNGEKIEFTKVDNGADEFYIRLKDGSTKRSTTHPVTGKTVQESKGSGSTKPTTQSALQKSVVDAFESHMHKQATSLVDSNTGLQFRYKNTENIFNIVAKNASGDEVVVGKIDKNGNIRITKGYSNGQEKYYNEYMDTHKHVTATNNDVLESGIQQYSNNQMLTAFQNAQATE